jgi:predicted PurR-regulated permease PerM
MAETTIPETQPPEPKPSGGGSGADRALSRAASIVLAVLGMVAMLHFAASVFITIFSSLLLAFALEPLVQLLSRKVRLRRHFAGGIVVFLFIAVLYGILYGAYLRAETFLTDIPEIAEKIRSAPLVNRLTQKTQEVSRLLSEAGQRISPASQTPARGKTAPPVVVQGGKSLIGSILSGVGSVTGVLFSLGFIPFLVYFILVDREPLTRRTTELFREENRETVSEILDDIERMMRKFLLGNAVIAAILSVATVLLYLMLGLPYPIVLGILSGTASIVPYLGLPLALLPGALVGLVSFHSGAPFLVMTAGVVVLHLVSANYLTPRFVGGEVHLNATASTAALLFFGWLWGGMGLLLGIPIVAVCKCVFENIPGTRRFGLWLGD